MRTALGRTIVLAASFLLAASASAGVLEVPARIQVLNQWCWAGSSEAILNYYGVWATQSEIGAYGTEGQNIWNWLYGSSTGPTRRGINMILDNWSVSNVYGYYTLTPAASADRIDAGQPFVIRWGWDAGGGHFVVGRGYEGDDIYYLDPWPGNGYQVATYDWMVRGGTHTWTHSLECTELLPATPTPRPTPSARPSATPSAQPTASPSPSPTAAPPPAPSATPFAPPTPSPSAPPSSTPLVAPTPGRLVIGADDYDGDGRSDCGLWRASDGSFRIRELSLVYYGRNGDVPVNGDYNGDGTADYGVWRPSSGRWWVRGLYHGTAADHYYGRNGDIPVPADYDGDFRTDTAVFRPETGRWYVKGLTAFSYGAPGDIPVPGDYDGDDRADGSLYRQTPSECAWFVRNLTRVFYGRQGDIPTPGDFNGDGATEIALLRPSSGRWYIRGEGCVTFGRSGDIPFPFDYEGDGTAERALYRPAEGRWYIYGVTSISYGASDDQPVCGRP
jgi:hypothetical protein